MKINLKCIPKRVFGYKDTKCTEQEKKYFEPVTIKSDLSILEIHRILERKSFRLIKIENNWNMSDAIERSYRLSGVSYTINAKLILKSNGPITLVIGEVCTSNELQYKKIINQLINKLKNIE